MNESVLSMFETLQQKIEEKERNDLITDMRFFVTNKVKDGTDLFRIISQSLPYEQKTHTKKPGYPTSTSVFCEDGRYEYFQFESYYSGSFRFYGLISGQEITCILPTEGTPIQIQVGELVTLDHLFAHFHEPNVLITHIPDKEYWVSV